MTLRNHHHRQSIAGVRVDGRRVDGSTGQRVGVAGWLCARAISLKSIAMHICAAACGGEQTSTACRANLIFLPLLRFTSAALTARHFLKEPDHERYKICLVLYGLHRRGLGGRLRL